MAIARLLTTVDLPSASSGEVMRMVLDFALVSLNNTAVLIVRYVSAQRDLESRYAFLPRMAGPSLRDIEGTTPRAGNPRAAEISSIERSRWSILSRTRARTPARTRPKRIAMAMYLAFGGFDRSEERRVG